ncbi:MAG: DoxX family membrane protein [Fluviicola sp.]
MELISHYHYIAGITIARIFIGFLFLFQGYDALFHIGLKEVTNTYHDRFRLKGIPRALTALAAGFTSYSAFICGVLLVLGFFETIALYILGVNLLIAGIGFGINEPLWDTRNVFPRMVLVLLLLLTPLEWHSLSLDQLVFKF